MAPQHAILGSAIKKARNDKNLTQEKLAELVGRSSAHIKQVESGVRNPSVPVLFSIVGILDMSIDTLLTNSDDSSQDLVNKINLSMGHLNVDELEITYATTEALRKNKDKEQEDKNRKED